MAGNSKSYAVRLLEAQEKFSNKSVGAPYPVDLGEVTNTGSGYAEIKVRLMNSGRVMSGTEIIWLIREDLLTPGDLVAVAYDVNGGPIVVSADYQDDPYIIASAIPLLGAIGATGPTGPPGPSIYPGQFQAIPTAAQATFNVGTAFALQDVWVDGVLQYEGASNDYVATSPYLVFDSPVVASQIVQARVYAETQAQKNVGLVGGGFVSLSSDEPVLLSGGYDELPGLTFTINGEDGTQYVEIEVFLPTFHVNDSDEEMSIYICDGDVADWIVGGSEKNLPATVSHLDSRIAKTVIAPFTGPKTFRVALKGPPGKIATIGASTDGSTYDVVPYLKAVWL